jgi:hypothetical protein
LIVSPGTLFVVSVYQHGDELVTSDDGVIEFDPLLPDQTSPWEVYVKDNPKARRVVVTYRLGLGPRVPAKGDLEAYIR